jgi:hypothetical protein
MPHATFLGGGDHARVPINIGGGGAIVDTAFANRVAHAWQGRKACRRKHSQLVARILDHVAQAPIADRQPVEARQEGAHAVIRVNALSGAAGGEGTVVG